MNQTILQKMTFWLALRLLDLSMAEAVDDIFLRNAHFTKISSRPPKYTRTTGSSSATLDAKAVDSISLKHSQNSGVIIMDFTPKGTGNYFHDLYESLKK
jgi:hypothetical protein